MTSAVNVSANIGSMLNGSIGGKSNQPAAAGFASLIDMMLGGQAGDSPTAMQLGTGTAFASLPVGIEPEGMAPGPLDALLAELAENLAALKSDIANEAKPGAGQLEELSELLEAIGSALEDLPGNGLQGATLEKLNALAQSLGLGGGQASGAGPLNALSALGAEIAAHLRAEAPDLAGKLSGLGRALDIEAARLETAAQAFQPDAQMKRHLLSTEIRPDANAAISEAGSKSGIKPDINSQGNVQPGSEPLKFTVAERPANSGASLDAQLMANLAKPEGTQTPAALVALAATASDAEVPEGVSPSPGGASPIQQIGTAPRATAPASAYVRAEPQINYPHIAVEIARHAQNGINRFEIRLNPPELGRIDVRLDLDQSGNVTARLAVERSETLDLLQRDQRALEKALAEAGLDGEKTDLEFSLQRDGDEQAGTDEETHWRARDTAEHTERPALPPGTLYRGYARIDAVDLRI